MKDGSAISFVHAADLHLDSPFVGLGEVDEEIANVLREATFKAFDNVVELCVSRSVNFLLVGGDVYDGADRSLKAQLAFRRGLQKLSESGIASYVVHGNHDPLDGWSSSLEWPERVHIFSGNKAESTPFECHGKAQAIIHGISFPHGQVNENLAKRFKSADLPLLQIGLLHCNVGTNTGHEPYAPCSLDDLHNAGLDYWALGHVHAKKVLSHNHPTVVYPGNTQGRHVNECGPRGCFYVSVDEDKEIETEFVPVDAVRWAAAEIEIESLDTEESLLSALNRQVEDVQEAADGRTCICRLVLKGRGKLHNVLQHSGYCEDLLQQVREQGRGLVPAVWIDRINVHTRPAVDVKARRQSEDIVGDLLRLVLEYKDSPERLSELREWLRELYDHGTCRKYLQMPNDEELLTLLEDVESLCLDKLLTEDGS